MSAQRVEVATDVPRWCAEELEPVAEPHDRDVVRRHRVIREPVGGDVDDLTSEERDASLGSERAPVRQDARRDGQLGRWLLADQHVAPTLLRLGP